MKAAEEKSAVKSACILTIHDAGDMTRKGKREIAEWLQKQAQGLIESGNLYGKRFTARYIYKSKN